MKPRSPNGERVLITRSRKGNAELAPKLLMMGFEPVAIDVLELSPPKDWSDVDLRIGRIDSYDWLVFTSAAGVRFFSERVAALDPGTKFGRAKVACVGTKTASAASEAGWKVDFVPSRALTKTLGEELPGIGKALLLRADISDKALPETLRARGFEVDDVVIYTTVPKEVLSTERVEEVDVIIFGSPSSVEGLCSHLSGRVMSRVAEKRAACLGPVTARAARAHGFKRIIQPADAHTFDALLEEVRKMYR
jgi:uroporphyrinogen-III synthase